MGFGLGFLRLHHCAELVITLECMQNSPAAAQFMKKLPVVSTLSFGEASLHS